MPSSTSDRPQRLRVQNFFVSRDGVAAGEDQSLERPFGHVDPGKLAAWAGATASWPNRTDPGGSRGLDDRIVRDFTHNIGAEIMGSHKFSPFRGPWENEDWTGWWGDEPPFHTPVFVLTSGYTFSGAEEFTYNLQTRGRATIVGETTGGGAHPVDGFDLGDGIVLRIPVGRAINPITKTNWEGTGVSPDVACPADDALDVAMELALEAVLDANPDSASAAWALDAMRARSNPITLSDDRLDEYTGEYGDREIRLEDGRLEYRRIGANANWRPLIAVGTDAFMIEGVQDFRMEFDRADGDAGGSIVGIRGVYRDGPSDYSERD